MKSGWCPTGHQRIQRFKQIVDLSAARQQLAQLGRVAFRVGAAQKQVVVPRDEADEATVNRMSHDQTGSDRSSWRLLHYELRTLARAKL